MTDRYLNGKIYTIRSHLTDDIYIGSTCLPLPKRLYKHRSGYKAYSQGLFNYITSFEILKFDDHYIELLEPFPCCSKAELEKREGECIRSMPCVNKVVAGRTHREWIEDNKESIAERGKIYYEINKEKIAETRAAYYEEKLKINARTQITCECGGIYNKSSLNTHRKTAKHLTLMAALTPIESPEENPAL